VAVGQSNGSPVPREKRAFYLVMPDLQEATDSTAVVSRPAFNLWKADFRTREAWPSWD
jgi:hypothetical protein